MIRYYLILGLVILASRVNSGPTNILCILVDDLGYGDLSCMGAEDMITPNIDGIASGGLTFTQFYANCPVCSPSRASLLTGMFPDLVGVPGVVRQWDSNNWGNLDDDALLLPQVLKAGGYHTAIIGKWHLGYEYPDRPNDRGFDYFKGFLGDMMDDYWTHLRGGINWMRHNEKEIDPKGHATDLFTEWAIEYMDQRLDASQPFFLYLAYNAPHFPIQPPEVYLERVKKREPDLTEKRAKNVAFIEHLDDCVGKVMAHLEKTGLIENTLVIFTSDNGGAVRYEQSNGDLRGTKQQMFEGGIRVPTFALWKGKIVPGSVTGNVSMLMDLFPTFCQVARVESPDWINGISLLPTLEGREQNTKDRYLFWVRREGGRYGGQAYYAARYGDYKILQNSAFEPYQFYHIGNDPLEQNPIDPADLAAYKELRDHLREHVRSSGNVPWQ